MKDKIQELLIEQFSPVYLEVKDESWKHAGHADAKPTGTHFVILVVSRFFEGKSLIERHRAVNQLFDQEECLGIHALKIKTCSPVEWEKVKTTILR